MTEGRKAAAGCSPALIYSSVTSRVSVRTAHSSIFSTSTSTDLEWRSQITRARLRPFGSIPELSPRLKRFHQAQDLPALDK